MTILINTLSAAWSMFLEASPYMLFGFAVAGLIRAVVKPEFISRHLGRGKWRPVILAALVGVPIPL